MEREKFWNVPHDTEEQLLLSTIKNTYNLIQCGTGGEKEKWPNGTEQKLRNQVHTDILS